MGIFTNVIQQMTYATMNNCMEKIVVMDTLFNMLFDNMYSLTTLAWFVFVEITEILNLVFSQLVSGVPAWDSFGRANAPNG